MKKSILPATLLALGLCTAVAPAAWTHEGKRDPAARVEKHMEQAAERLKLSDAQKQQLQPIVEEHVTKAKAIRDKYPKDASPEQKKQMFDEMHAVREDYDAKFRAVLDEQQRQEWEKMRSERRERMREHVRERKERETT